MKVNKKISINCVVSMVIHKVLAKLNIFNNTKYINFSILDYIVEANAPVVSMVTHQSNKLGSREHLGSNPSWGASTFSFNKLLIQKKNKPLPLGRGHREAMPFFLSQKLLTNPHKKFLIWYINYRHSRRESHLYTIMNILRSKIFLNNSEKQNDKRNIRNL